MHTFKIEMRKWLEEKFGHFFKKNKAKVFFVVDIVLNIVIIVTLVFLIRTFLISPFQVYGQSMCDTLNNIDDRCEQGFGEYIIVNKFVYQNLFGVQVGLPQRGDIIVFHPPHNDKEFYIKRIIGLPGETVKLIDGNVHIFNKEHLQGYQLPEPYLNTDNQGNTKSYPGQPDVFEVPAGKYFVLGDNRLHSSDSRICFKESSLSPSCGTNGATAFLGMNNIEGKAWVVLWPLSKLAVLGDPKY